MAGWKAGLLTSTLNLAYFLPPSRSVLIENHEHMIQFVLVGVITTMLVLAMRRWSPQPEFQQSRQERSVTSGLDAGKISAAVLASPLPSRNTRIKDSISALVCCKCATMTPTMRNLIAVLVAVAVAAVFASPDFELEQSALRSKAEARQFMDLIGFIATVLIVIFAPQGLSPVHRTAALAFAPALLPLERKGELLC